MELKYVIINKNGYDYPIIFPVTLDHSTFKDNKIISAGFVDITAGFTVDDPSKIECVTYGKSVTLNVNSRQEDDAIISNMIAGQPYY